MSNKVKKRMSTLFITLTLITIVPTSVAHAAGPLCALTVGAIVRRLAIGITAGFVSGVAVEAVMGGGVRAQTANHSSSNGSDRSTQTIPISEITKPLTYEENQQLRHECDQIGGVFPYQWRGSDFDNPDVQDRVLFFRNIEAGANPTGALCLRY